MWHILDKLERVALCRVNYSSPVSRWPLYGLSWLVQEVTGREPVARPGIVKEMPSWPSWQYVKPRPPWIRRHLKSHQGSWWLVPILKACFQESETDISTPHHHHHPSHRTSVSLGFIFNQLCFSHLTTTSRSSAKLIRTSSGQPPIKRYSWVISAYCWFSHPNLCGSWTRDTYRCWTTSRRGLVLPEASSNSHWHLLSQQHPLSPSVEK